MATTTELQPLQEMPGAERDVLQTILESLPMGIVVADGEGKLLFSNPAAEIILGAGAPGAVTPQQEAMEPVSVCGWYLPDKITLLDPDRLPLVRAIRGEQVSNELLFVQNFRHPKGIWIRVSGRPLRTEASAEAGGVIIFYDVTQERGAMQTILLLSQVVEQIADSVLLTDKSGMIRYVNPAFVATTGYVREEVQGKTPRILKSGLHDAEFYRQLWDRLLQGQTFQGMMINRKKSGELYWAQQAITPIRDEAGRLTHFVSVLQDITDLRKKQEQEFQLQLARDVQRQFYGAAPVVAGYDIGAAAYPAYETGGDYFDFISAPDGSLVIAVGDVEGHGFGSALLMALTRAYLRSFASLELELDEMLERANRMLVKDLDNGRFVTLCLARLDLQGRVLTYASAGHVPGFVLRGGGEPSHTLRSTGPPLGLFAESRFCSQEPIALEAGEMVVLLTDGVTESAAPDGAEFGTERTLDYIWTQRHRPAQQIVDGMYGAVREFVRNEPQHDDITSVVIKVGEKTAEL